ncbi:hypothetical protein SUGI_0016660 [Cryptomeria japonica]|nr:hypothetical protein SUGI_0016660 [Cryptomeria japonica]
MERNFGGFGEKISAQNSKWSWADVEDDRVEATSDPVHIPHWVFIDGKWVDKCHPVFQQHKKSSPAKSWPADHGERK